jgi:hypothetical protein
MNNISSGARLGVPRSAQVSRECGPRARALGEVVDHESSGSRLGSAAVAGPSQPKGRHSPLEESSGQEERIKEAATSTV